MKTLLTAALVGLCLVPPARAADPAEELLRFVPPDVSFCLVIRDLRGHTEALTASPFGEALGSSPLGLALKATPEWQQLARADQLLQKYFQISSTQLRDDIFGDAVVLAYRAGPPGKPDEGLCP